VKDFLNTGIEDFPKLLDAIQCKGVDYVVFFFRGYLYQAVLL
jgi:hypothetical protein